MEIKILDDRPNPLLKRHEYRFQVDHATAATPSRDAVRSELSKLVHAPKDRVIIERMGARYGTAVTQGDAMVYETADVARSTTREHILVRNGLKEKPAAGGPAAPKAEVPAEPAKPEAAPAEPPAKAPAPAPAAPAEAKAEAKAEPEAEPKAPHKGDAKGETHKSEHKPRAPKADKGEKAEKPSTTEGGT